MPHPNRIRSFAPLLAFVAAAGYCVEGAIVVRAPQGDSGWHASGYAVEAAFVIALLASIPLVGALRHSSSRASTIAAWLVRVGFGAMLVSAVPSLVAGKDMVGPAFLLGVLASLVGLGWLAVVETRTRADGWWAAPVVATGLVLSMVLGDHGGGILLGLAWAATIPAARDCGHPATVGA